MIKEEDHIFVKHMRSNSRLSISRLSSFIGMPHTTVFQRVRRICKIITKSTSMYDFSAIGYGICIMYILRTDPKNRGIITAHLKKSRNINNVYRTERGFLVEAYFRNLDEAHKFLEGMERVAKCRIKEYPIIKEIEKEKFYVPQKV